MFGLGQMVARRDEGLRPRDPAALAAIAAAGVFCGWPGGGRRSRSSSSAARCHRRRPDGRAPAPAPAWAAGARRSCGPMMPSTAMSSPCRAEAAAGSSPRSRPALDLHVEDRGAAAVRATCRSGGGGNTARRKMSTRLRAGEPPHIGRVDIRPSLSRSSPRARMVPIVTPWLVAPPGSSGVVHIAALRAPRCLLRWIEPTAWVPPLPARLIPSQVRQNP